MTGENKTVHIHPKYFEIRGRNWVKKKEQASEESIYFLIAHKELRHLEDYI